jgi:hypothetical protein
VQCAGAAARLPAADTIEDRRVAMKTIYVTACAALLLISAALPVSAHHSWPVNMSRLVTVKGTVTDFTWSNPHPMINLEVKTPNGTVEKWVIGGPAINRMEDKGWNKSTVKPGDTITGIGYQFADGQKVLRLERVVFADGKEMLLYATR